MQIRTRASLFVLAMCAAASGHGAAPQPAGAANDFAPVRQIGIHVLPYYEAARTPEGAPMVSVARSFDARLASNAPQDILAVRDAIAAQPQLTTPMTLMVLAIRLYDAGLRDEAVFWFYAAKNRYFSLAGVVDVKSPMLSQAEDAIRNFAILAGPVFNGYAFCDLAKQRDASARSIAWVEQHPYQAVFMEQLPALPGDRAENLKKTIEDLKARALEDKQYLDDPKNLAEFNRKRIKSGAVAQFCWAK